MCFHKEILILKIDVATHLDINNIFSFNLKHTNHLNQCLMANLKGVILLVTISISCRNIILANIWYLSTVVIKHET